MKLRKIGENENVVLPPIKSSSDNPSVFDYHKYYNNTESVLRSGKDDESIKKKLNKILLKPIKPKMNDSFLTKEIKMQKVRQIHKNLFNKKRNEDNDYYKQRIKNQKAFINPKMMDKHYNKEHVKAIMKLRKIGENENVVHVKAIMKLRKIGENENVVLPPIKSSSDNPSVFEFHKYYNSTESALKSGKDNESNIKNMKSINASSVSNTYYGHNKDSGTNSVDK